jgi:alpha-L-fucosidase
MRITKATTVLLSIGLLLGGQQIAYPSDVDAPLETQSKSTNGGATDAEKLTNDLGWFTDARFGMFIHWGPVSLTGSELSWSRGAAVPVERYDQLYKQFDPVDFDAAEWVALAKAAGMKYLVITAKHHDGFSLWDSAHSDYDIMATPFTRNVLAELAQECERQRIRFCLYYSILDWYHPDYPTDSPAGRGAKPAPNMDRYVAFMKAQLRELIDNYGPLGIIWFDGEWEAPWTVERGDDLYRFVKSLQPDIIVNNRVNKARDGMAGTTRQDIENPGDYDTPEQQIGAFNRDRPWETCMTLGTQWSWKPDDRIKSLSKCLRTLIRTAGGDGNLLFNVGPMPDGRIESRQARRLQEMGRWLDRFGEGIYGTRGGPFKPGAWGASTCHDHSVYLFVMRWPDDGPLMLPALDANVESAESMTGGRASLRQSGDSWLLWIDEEHRDLIATVVRLELDRPSFEITPVDVPTPPSGSIARDGKATASNTFRDMAEYGPGMAFDDDPTTRWATDNGTKRAWLAVDLGDIRSIRRAVIVEGDWNRVRRYELQVAVDDDWTTVATGERLGPRTELRFGLVEARCVRLHILDATEGPTIWEFQILAD